MHKMTVTILITVFVASQRNCCPPNHIHHLPPPSPVLLPIRHWLSKQQQHPHCDQGHVYCEDREGPWLPRGCATSGQKGMQTLQQNNSQFRLCSKKRHGTDRQSPWPNRITRCQNKRQYEQFVSAVTNFGAPKPSVNASRSGS